MSVNLRGTFFCLREDLNIMLTQNHGTIGNISARSGHIGNGSPVGDPYCVSKSEIICLTKAEALDVVHKGIRINTIAPDPIEGPTNLKNLPEINAAMVNKIPLKRIVKPEEIAYAVIF
jgi:3-oxoacyl-[acyl-carrier protein] reductase